MEGIQNIIFDLGGVFLDLDVRRTHTAFREIGMEKIEVLFKNGMATSFFKQYETGELTDVEFIRAIRTESGWKGSDERIIQGWNAMLVGFPPERLHWLNRLKNNYRLFLFSNTNALHLVTIQQMYSNTMGGGLLDDHFEKAYYSHEVGVRKPNAEAYELVVSENRLDKKRTVFVDDALVNVEAAIKTGLLGIHLEPGVEVNSLPF